MELIIGKAKTGKTSYLFDLAESYVKEDKKVIYLVPSQMRVVTEENFLNLKNKNGILGINFTTISSFVKEYISLETIKNKENYINNVDRKLILSTLLSNSKINFKLFNKVKNKEGFIDNLSIYMDIFKKSELETKDIQNLSLDNKLLEYKLKELNLVYNEYKEFTKDKFVDDLDEMDFFNNKFYNDFKTKYADDIDKYVFIFDSYNNFTKKEFTFISNLIKLGFNIKFSISSDIIDKVEDEYFVDKSLNEIMSIVQSSEISSIYDISNLTILNLIKECKILDSEICCKFKSINHLKSKNDIKYLASNIFSLNEVPKIKCENVHVNLYSNIYQESKAIAKNILQYIDQGYRYSDMAILTNNIDEYEYSISKTFLEYNIPVHIDLKQKLSSNFLVRYIINLLKLNTIGFKKDVLLEVLKSGLLDIDFKDISYLENYMLEFNIEGFKFTNKFKVNNSNNSKIYDLELLNNLRLKILDIFSDFDELKEDKSKLTNCDNIIKCIYNHLEKNNILDNYFKIVEEFKVSEDSKVIYIGKVNEEGYNYLVSIFDSISKIYTNSPIDIKEFSKLFNIAVKEFKLKSILPTIDEILLADINSTKLTTKKVLFIIGINEDVFPSAISPDILFNDDELSYLDEEDIKIKETSISKTNMELFNLYEHLNNVTESIYISYLSADSSGASLRISNVIGKVCNILDLNIHGSVANINEDVELNELRSKMEALELLSFKINNEDNINDDTLGIYKYLSLNKEYEDVIKYNRETEKLSDNTLEKLYKEKINLSVSRLELFSKCAFAYHLKYNLKLDERKIYSITSMDIGSLMHDIVEKFSYYLINNNIMWHEILLDKERYNLKIEELILQEISNVFSKHEENIKYMVLKQKLISTMKKVIMTIAESYNNSRFIPLGYEIEFDEKGEYTPITINLDNGKVINLIGKIDRVDVLETEDSKYIRIVDYKSSNKTLSIDDIKEKISLQLITYMSAIINNMNEKSLNESGLNDNSLKEEVKKEAVKKVEIKKVKPAGMVYFTLSEKLLNIKEYTDDEQVVKDKLTEALKMKGIFLKDVNIMKLMDKEVGSKKSLIDVSTRTLNSDKISKKILAEEEFSKLCSEIQNILKEICTDLIGGNINIKPNKKQDHCKYCEYRSICRKENMR